MKKPTNKIMDTLKLFKRFLVLPFGELEGLFFMKQKMLKLMLLFLTISLFSSSKENTAVAKCKCVPEDKIQESGLIKAAGSGAAEEHPLTMLPGNFLFFY